MKSPENAFVKFVRDSIGEDGLSLNIKNSRWVNSNGFKCWGFFDQEQICVAKKNPRWIEVLAHEYSHFIQWKSGTPLYKKCFGPTNNYSDVVEDWLSGKDFDHRMVRRAFETYRSMERECEKITVKILQKHSIPCDIERYKQEANLSIYMYHYMEMTRIKSFKKDPDWRIIRKMPASFRSQSHKTVSKEILDIVEELA